MKIARIVPIALLLIVALLAAACGGGAAEPTSAPSGDNNESSSSGGGPAAAVQAFFEAVYGGDENIVDYVCSSSPEIVDTYEQAAEALATVPDTTIDTSGLTYTVTEENADSATVEVSGELSVTAAGQTMSTPFQAVPIPVVNENGSWKVCASVG
ncbi:MAG TPA: hypothetical protein VK003_14550 [Oceanobacillus sp.]|nr:hypothetical protein [Oceanobacillus sp.]